MPVRPPSLRSIAAFEAAARHQSFARAAEELNLTRSAITHAIRALETRLDRKLFTRAARHVTLTPEGQLLASRVRLSLSLLAGAFDTAPWLAKNKLTISLLPSVAQKIVLPALGALRTAFPDLLLDIRCSAALASLGSEIDLAIRFGPGTWAGLQSRLLGREYLFPVAAPDYRGGKLPRTVQELGDCELIHHVDSHWQLWLDPLGEDSADFPSLLAIDDSTLVLEAAAAGHGIALARARLVRADLESGRLVRLFPEEVEAEYAYWAVWSSGSPKHALIEQFVSELQRLF